VTRYKIRVSVVVVVVVAVVVVALIIFFKPVMVRVVAVLQTVIKGL